jgi:hypothetical protein
MSGVDEVDEGLINAAKARVREPAPVEEEVHRSAFSSGLVKMLLGIAAAGAIGTAAAIWYQNAVRVAGVPGKTVPMVSAGNMVIAPLNPPPPGLGEGNNGGLCGSGGSDANQEPAEQE